MRRRISPMRKKGRCRLRRSRKFASHLKSRRRRLEADGKGKPEGVDDEVAKKTAAGGGGRTRAGDRGAAFGDVAAGDYWGTGELGSVMGVRSAIQACLM